MQKVWKLSGKKPPELDELPPIPQTLEYLWEYYAELCSKERLSFTEIKNWCELTKTTLTVVEVKALKQIDLVFHANLQPSNKAKKKNGNRSSRADTQS